MIIGHYAHNLGAPGGIATYVRRLADAQRQRGLDVVLLSAVPPSADIEGPELRVVGGFAGLRRVVTAGEIEILHAHSAVPFDDGDLPVVRTMHGNHGSCLGGGRFLARSGTPCTRAYDPTGCFWHRLTEHCGSLRPSRYVNDVRRTHLEMANAASMRTLTVSAFLRDQMKRSGVDVSGVHVLRSPAPDVQIAPAPPPEDGIPRFIFLGRLVPQKGLDWLLRAVALMDADAVLEVAGDGNLDEYAALARDLGIRHRVTFHGWLSSDAVPDLLARSRAVVFPSLWSEPAGLVTLEGAAHGRAVVASMTGGIPEYADPSFSFLVDPGDASAMAARLNRLATDPHLAASMGAAGRAHVRAHHSMTTFLDALDDHYARVQAGVRSTRSRRPTLSSPHLPT